MNRKLERRLVYFAGVWQIIDGVITILFYGSYIRKQASNIEGLSYEYAKGLDSIFGSIYSFIGMFGVLLIGLGLLNLYFAKRHLKDSTLAYKVPFWLIGTGIFSYFIMDIPSLILCMSAGVIALSKNKSLKLKTI